MTGECAQQVRAFVRGEGATVPAIAAGNTAGRLRVLRDIARADLSVARLIEGHLDALAILAEAGHEHDPAAVHAIWASGGPSRTRLSSSGALSGVKMFASGSDLVDTALVLVDASDELALVDMKRWRERVTFDGSAWQTPALRATHTWTVTFHEVPATVVGAARWYYERPGFWHGALCPAACWAGGALGLLDHARSQEIRSPHGKAHLGRMLAETWSMETALSEAGRAVDVDPTDAARYAYPARWPPVTSSNRDAAASSRALGVCSDRAPWRTTQALLSGLPICSCTSVRTTPRRTWRSWEAS